MGVANRVIKNTGILYAKMGITMFVSLYTTRVVLNALGASDFGIFNIVGGAIAMLAFLNASMASATQRFMSFAEGQGDKEKQKTIFNISFVLHILIAMVLGLALLGAGYVFFNGVLNIVEERIYAAKVVYGSLIVSTMFTVMSVPYDAVLNAHENMLYYSLVGILESLLKLGVALAIVNYAGDKLILYGVLMAAIPLITMTLMRIYCHHKYEECNVAPKRYWDKAILKEMSGFAGWSFFGSSVGILSNYGQGIVLNVFFGTVVNASQGIANQIAGQLSVFSTTMLRALNPVIVKKEGAGDRKDMIKLTMTGSKLSFALLAIFSMPVIIEMPFILSLWLKNVPDYAIVFCRLLLVRMLIEQMFVPLSTSISATGQIKQYQITISIFALVPVIVSLGAFFFGAPPYALYIVFILHVLLRSFTVVLHYSNKLFGLPIRRFVCEVVVKCLLSMFLASVLCCIPYIVLSPHVYRALAVGGMFMACFSILFYLLSLDRAEKSLITAMITSVIERIKSIVLRRNIGYD